MRMYDTGSDGEPIAADYEWAVYSCGTCGCLSFFGCFRHEKEDNPKRARLYPKGSSVLPPAHMLSPRQPIPDRILESYEEVWPIRHRSPTAFVGQIRRLLELICKDKDASGQDLFEQLNDLIGKGIFPGYFQDITDLLRRVGNMGTHASETRLDEWDAELIDDFFRSIIEYVYIAPAKIKRMEERIRPRSDDQG